MFQGMIGVCHYNLLERHLSLNANMPGNRWQRKVCPLEGKRWPLCIDPEHPIGELYEQHPWEHHLPTWQLHLELGVGSSCKWCSYNIVWSQIDTYTISKGFVKTWNRIVNLWRREEQNNSHTTWQPPAIPPAKSSHLSFIWPVSGSMALARTKSLTVSLMAFSGATP